MNVDFETVRALFFPWEVFVLEVGDGYDAVSAEVAIIASRTC